ncbi:hypothetical protein LMH73_027100, partial [Vibrio splendidus]
ILEYNFKQTISLSNVKSKATIAKFKAVLSLRLLTFLSHFTCLKETRKHGKEETKKAEEFPLLPSYYLPFYCV